MEEQIEILPRASTAMGIVNMVKVICYYILKAITTDPAQNRRKFLKDLRKRKKRLQQYLRNSQ